MEFRFIKWGWRFYFATGLRKVETVTGVNSQIDEDRHFLMWDFDGVALSVVQTALQAVQREFELPNIYIIKTGKGYHAYCFKALWWVEARGIIASTDCTDPHYISIGISRGYFTLRFTGVTGNYNFNHTLTLLSDVPADLEYADVNSFVHYTKAVN